MQPSKRLFAFFGAVLLATILGCAPTATRQGTGGYVDDTMITTKVKAAILKTPGLKSSEINVETYKSVVQLSGFVSSQSDMAEAVKAAEGVGGVTSVKNDMRLRQ